MRDVLDMLHLSPYMTGRTLVAALVTVLLAAAVARFFASDRSNKRRASADPARFSPEELDDSAARPCTVAGPVLAARVANLDLSGLTVIPITRLPRLRKWLRIPFTDRTVVVFADLTASELVFRRLKVGSATTSSRDVGRDAIQVTAHHVEVDLTGSIGVRAGYYLEGQDERRGRAVRASGRVHVALTEASSRIVSRLVSRAGPGSSSSEAQPGLVCRRVDFHPGTVSLLSLTGFVPFLRAEALLHYVRNSPLVRISTRRFAAFLVQELVHGPVCSDLLSDLEGFVGKHVDLDTFAGIDDRDRDRALARFFHDSVHPPHHDSEEHTSTTEFTTTSAPASPTALRLHALILGPIRLHSLSLPSSAASAENGGTVAVPVFARRNQTGLRYSILSSPILNQLTRGPPDVSFGPSTFERLELDEASIELEPHPLEVLEGGTNGGKASEPGAAAVAAAGASVGRSTRELVLRVHGLAASLSIGFRIGAGLRAAPALVTGMKVLEEKGVAKTEIAERSTLRKPPHSNGDSLPSDGTLDVVETTADDEADGIAIRLPLRWDRSSGRVVLTSRHDDEDALVAESTSSSSSTTAPSPRRRQARSRTGGGAARGIRLEGALGTVAPRIKLESRLGKLLGERVVNALLEGVQTHLAALTVPLASHFLADLARQRLQRTLDSVNERMATEGGVLWTSPEPQPPP
ncbi:hypothetical protein JCM3774_003511 [Rhodotorula dairenensis]